MPGTNRTMNDILRVAGISVLLLLVLGAPNSSNSLRLCEVSSSLGVPAHLIESAADIRPEWLEGVRTLGLTASASAPEILVREVVGHARTHLGIERIEEFETVKEDVKFLMPAELKRLLQYEERGEPAVER